MTELLLQSIAEGLDIGIVACDANYRLRFWNTLGPKLFGVPAAMFQRGRPIQDIFSFFAERGDYGPGRPHTLAVERLQQIAQETWLGPHSYFHVRTDANAIQVRVQRNVNGDLVFQLSDVLGVQSILEGTEDAIVFVDQFQRIISFNRGAELIFGWSAADAVGEPLDILMPERYRDEHRNHIKAFGTAIVRAQSMQGRSEIVGLRKSGEEFPAEASIAKIRTGGALVFAAILRDISGRRRLEAAGRQSEAALRQAQKLAKLGYYRWSKPRQRLISYNDEYRQILGLPAMGAAGELHGIEPFVHPEDRDRVVQAHRKAEAEGSSVEVDFRIVHPDGAVRYLRDLNEAEPNPGGPPETWFGTVQDITDLKERELQLSQSEAALDQAARLAKLAHYQRSKLEGHYLRLSEQYFEIVGIPVDNPLKDVDYVNPYIHLEDRERVIRERGAAEAKGRYLDLEFRIVRPDGGIRYIHEIAELKPGQDGSADVYFGTLQDVTDEKRVEAELRQSQKLQSIGTLAGGIAHELNNLLVPIIGLTELTIEKLPERGRNRNNLSNVLAAAERARVLVQNILAFSRRDTPNRQWIALEPLIDEVMAMLRPVLPANVAVRQSAEEGVPAVPADATQIHQVLINLVSNASAAMGLQGGVLELSVAGADLSEAFCHSRPGLVPGRYAKLVVGDTGHGMDPETQRRIFEPFFTTKKVGDGTGMGLSVVHGIVQSHRGAIEVESAVGQGTRFTTYFPAFDADAATT
jgi:PAS domain S-box-containing protein